MKNLILALLTVLSIGVSASSAFSLDKQSQIDQIKIITIIQAEKHGVPSDLALALVKVESGYNPKVRGAHGEYGLGQILCGTAKSMGYTGKCAGLLDPETNLTYSMIYLRRALDKANNDKCHAATLYSSGLDNKPRASAYCRKVIASIN